MTHALTPARELDRLPEYPMPRAQRCPFDPAPELTELAGQAPLTRVRLWDGSTPWLVTRHAEQRALLADKRISSDTSRPGFPHTSAGFRARRQAFRTMINMDDPEHARLRRMVTGSFTMRRIEGLRPAIQEIVDRLIEDLLAGPRPADLVTQFALPVPSLVICAMLGVPYADHDYFQGLTRALIKRDAPAQESRRVQGELTAYLTGLVDRKLADPADDLLSRLAAEHVVTGEMTRDELASMGTLLLVAGHETTANMIALGTLALLTHPDQLAAVRETEDEKLVAQTVEELLRYLSIVHAGRRRVALADIELDGQLIRAGEGVIVPGEIGNRDPAAFPDPDRLDVRRDARRHMAFGFGVHQCLGQPLARLELQVVYATLYRRIPSLALAAGLADIPFKHDGLIYGVYELPVTW